MNSDIRHHPECPFCAWRALPAETRQRVVAAMLEDYHEHHRLYSDSETRNAAQIAMRVLQLVPDCVCPVVLRERYQDDACGSCGRETCPACRSTP